MVRAEAQPAAGGKHDSGGRGHRYADGLGVPQDIAEAAEWYRKAADQGDVKAQTNLGVMYYEGHEVPQDYIEAAKWYRKAAEQGNAKAQFNLGLIYMKGQSVAQDYVQAHMWLNLAAAQGIKRGAEGRDIAAKRMTPADVSKAQRLAREWLEKHGK